MANALVVHKDIGRRRSRGRTVIGWCNVAGRRISPCGGWWPNSPSGAWRSITARMWVFVHAEKLSYKRRR
jgi:hypothetical protein